ncbi:MAG: uroporphyrinogen-III synthase [Gemmatimonadetes bacterium]|nr:uroporphyrinogen-III synthase [Gemmatimonadota bacterium]
MAGTVYFVGAGPGAPGLVTVRGAELLRRADAVVYDAPATEGLLDEVRDGVLQVPVGGAGSWGGEPGALEARRPPAGDAEAVGVMLADLAFGIQVVVRLWHGDPLLFGSAAHEAAVVSARGIRFEMVPGVPVETAALAYAGIPAAQAAGAGGLVGVSLLAGAPPADVDAIPGSGGWAPGGTLVFRLGAGEVAAVADRLLAEGRSPDTPVALIASRRGVPRRTVVSSLIGIADAVTRAGPQGDAIAVVGDAVSWRRQLTWFERKPLFGRTILVTRAREQAPEFSGRLAEEGAEVIEFPAIRFENPEDPAPLQRAARQIGRYHWVVFTSANGVAAFWKALRAEALDARALRQARVCAIGPATSSALEAVGIVPDVVPERYIAEAVVEALAAADELRGRHVLLPRAAVARRELPEGLAARGALVDEVAAYRTLPDAEGAQALRPRLAAGEIDLVTFTSSSTARSYHAVLGTTTGGAGVAAIGPVTAGTARELGFRVDVVAEEYTIPGLVRACIKFFTGRA